MEDNARVILQTFIAQFDALTDEEKEMIADNLVVEAYPKGKVLVKAGEVCSKCYFVLKGCLRQYMMVDDVEKTTQFFTENEAAVLFSSYTNQTRSESFLSCVEDTVVILGDMNEEAAMYEKFPKLQQITRAMMEQDFGKTQDHLSRFIASTAEERYLNLMETRPDLLQRVPLNQLASYIGITPESLSRIRKRIQKSS